MAEKRCFVISPIGAEGSEVGHHADNVFRFIIQPATEDFDIAPVRSDQMQETGRITQQMFEELVRADMGIAILTGLNPNVFYEVAVAQSAARPMVILIVEGEALPFNVQDLRCINYEADQSPDRRIARRAGKGAGTDHQESGMARTDDLQAVRLHAPFQTRVRAASLPVPRIAEAARHRYRPPLRPAVGPPEKDRHSHRGH